MMGKLALRLCLISYQALLMWLLYKALVFGRPHCLKVTPMSLKVNSLQGSGNEAIRTQIQPPKPKREITNITNSQNTKRTYGQDFDSNANPGLPDTGNSELWGNLR